MNTSRAPALLCVALLAACTLGCQPDSAGREEKAAAFADTVVVAAEGAGLVGTWAFDAETQAWLNRACVVLDFPDPEAATFDLAHEAGELFVRFHNPARTVWRAPFREAAFEAQQILPTTPSGRFCGRETVVRLRLREVRPGVLLGVWQTPHCDVCPNRHFGATRVGG